MKHLPAMRHIVTTATAALCFWFGALSALPQYPNSVPWPQWVSVSAVAGALATYLLWFHAASWAINRSSQFRSALVRILVYASAFVGVVTVVFAPLLPAYGIFGLCSLGLDCGERMQGAFNVLHVSAFKLKAYVAIPICLIFVCVAIQLSNRTHAGKGAA